MGSDPTWQNWCLLLRSKNSYFVIDIRLEITTASEPQLNLPFLTVVFTHIGKIYTQIYTRKSKTVYKNDLRCSWKLTVSKNTMVILTLVWTPSIYALCMYLGFWIFEHRLRGLLGNTKGKVIGRDRKGNYDKLLIHYIYKDSLMWEKSKQNEACGMQGPGEKFIKYSSQKNLMGRNIWEMWTWIIE